MRWLVVAALATWATAQEKEPKKLLYPIMIQGGPNNQYQHFLESMILAKALRRPSSAGRAAATASASTRFTRPLTSGR